jgi:hypothetical protein
MSTRARRNVSAPTGSEATLARTLEYMPAAKSRLCARATPRAGRHIGSNSRMASISNPGSHASRMKVSPSGFLTVALFAFAARQREHQGDRLAAAQAG